MKNQLNMSQTELVALTENELTVNGGYDAWGPIAVGGAINPETGEPIAVLYGPLPGPRKPFPVKGFSF
jgi:hypothetical protein